MFSTFYKLFIGPKKPHILPETMKIFEDHGLSEVKEMIARNRGGASLYITHGPKMPDATSWVRWQEARRDWRDNQMIWIATITLVASIIAAIASVLAIIK